MYLMNEPNFCGPYAIYNAKIWRGGQEPDINLLKQRCHTTNYFGTSSENMANVIYNDFEISQRKSNDPTKIKKALSDGYGIILGYKADHTDGHWAFFHQVNGIIYGVSDRKDRSVKTAIDKDIFETYLKRHYERCVGTGLFLTHPKAWFIARLN